MSLLVSKVPRALEIKARLFGFELGDLLFGELQTLFRSAAIGG